MKFLLAITFAFHAISGWAQGPTPAAKAADVKSVESIVAALYDVISGPPGAKHDWDRMRSLFTVDARLIAVGKRGEVVRSRVFSVDDYVKLSGPVIEKGGFVEREIAHRTEQFANIAHVFSTYESRIKVDDKKPFARGINSIQLYNDGSRWWIETVYWQDESGGTTLPDKYLHNG
jgi:hypothetical protein